MAGPKPARVAEAVDAGDLNSLGQTAIVGSNPTPGTRLLTSQGRTRIQPAAGPRAFVRWIRMRAP